MHISLVIGCIEHDFYKCEDLIKNIGKNIEYIADIRMGLAIAAGIVFQKMPKNLVAVTGTNGKSSVVSYVHQILTKLEKNC